MISKKYKKKKIKKKQKKVLNSLKKIILKEGEDFLTGTKEKKNL